MPIPKSIKNRYSSQAVISLCPSLDDVARSLQRKREVAGDGERCDMFLSGNPVNQLPEQFTQAGSRLYILAHGEDNDHDNIFFKDGKVICDVLTLGRRIETWLNKRTIKHIGLHVCYGGGFRKDGTANLQCEGWKVKIEDSFAWQLAEICGYATTIGAYTDVHAGHFHDQPKPISWYPDFLYYFEKYSYTAFGTVGDNERYKVKGDKVIITPDPAATPSGLRKPTGWAFAPKGTDQGKEKPF